MTVEFRADPGGQTVGVAGSVWTGDACVASLQMQPDDRVLMATVRITDESRCGHAEAIGILDCIDTHANSGGFQSIEMDAGDMLVRHHARARGFGGALRGRLALRLDDRPRRGTSAPDAGSAGSKSARARVLPGANADEGPAAELGVAVADLVPGVSVRAAQTASGLGRVLRRAVSGVRDMVDLHVVSRDSGASLDIAAPLRPDLMLESVARAVETALAVAHRFPRETRSVRLSFDRQYASLDTKSWAGGANPKVAGGLAMRDMGMINLNTAYAAADLFVDLRRWRLANPAERPALRVQPPFDVVDGTVAHEMWHLIEGAFEAGRYRDSIEFRRRLGVYFGADTIERVFFPTRAAAVPVAEAARTRLREEVSPYATTNSREATAELFKAWWCRVGSPTPAVAHFGELLERFFPCPP